MIITIDGPAGAGKSTVARRLAARLGFGFLDTGAMYRAVAWAGMRCGVDWQQPDQLADLAERLDMRFDGERIFVGGEDASQAIRTVDVTAVTRYAADNPRVRSRLVELQRQIGAAQNIVTEGRDQGTVVFPQAQCKFFLTASPAERARRRVAEMQAKGIPADYDAILAAQQRRDAEDATRAVGAMIRADDAVEFITDGLSIDQVVERLVEIVQKRVG